jgi:zinc transport system substrate-binding protein
MNRKILVTVLIFLLLLILGVLLPNKKASSPLLPSNQKIKVAASFYPLYYFVSEVGKDMVDVTNLTPAGAEPHDYEPNAQDIAKLETTQLVVVNGVGLEPWWDKVRGDLQQKKVKTLEVADGMVPLADPHIWLDPVLAKQEVIKITSTLSEVDPEHKMAYETNSKQLQEKLDALDVQFQESLSHCNQKNIIASHQAFGYLAQRYGLHQLAISGISPEQEPTPAELGKITQFAKNNKVKYIFFETLVSPRLAETLADEVGAQTLVFDPLEGVGPEDQAKGKDYFSVQKENLDNLKIALECK